MRKPETILFDLWGTLIRFDAFDSKRGNEAVLQFAENPRCVGLDDVQALADRVIAAVGPWEETSRIEFTHQALLRILGDVFDLRFRRGLQELEEVFWSAALTIRPTDGVREALAHVADLGIRSCVVSNSSFTAATLEKELQKRGLARYFRFVMSSADYCVRKPEGVLFEVALSRLGASAETSWFIGDNIVYDVKGAWDAGMFPVVYNGNAPVPRDVTEYRSITHWSELTSLLDSL